ncbi:AraC-like DNA-binding protein [Dyadobacter jejuensis]|uniref:AraC-like DNA-binding protein n=1 Tax=Dyadobacter jejuensis TaxID=1082580 RepID=A0A316AKU8_9BACT|nr:AraC family transcriptional regulator [Dyadobacter jejuensis]PWJ57998.1 AraC-like DNA-binding protein [Dyadobacter jejuensis]
MHHLIALNRFQLLNTAEVMLDKTWDYTNVLSPFYRLYYIEGGGGMVSFAGAELSLKPGHLYLIPDFQLSNYQCTHSCHQFYVHFEEQMEQGVSIKTIYNLQYEIEATDLDIALIKRLLLINPNSKLPFERPTSLSKVQLGPKEDYHMRVMETQGILFQLVSRFLSASLLSAAPANGNYFRISKTLQYIHAHLSEDLSVGPLASQANLNPDYFSRIFQELIGQRPISYVHQLRVQKAQYHLLFSDATQDEVADLVGFSNRPYFAKIFKRYTGKSVGQYRDQASQV